MSKETAYRIHLHFVVISDLRRSRRRLIQSSVWFFVASVILTVAHCLLSNTLQCMQGCSARQ